jgi:hypothetical protein
VVLVSYLEHERVDAISDLKSIRKVEDPNCALSPHTSSIFFRGYSWPSIIN